MGKICVVEACRNEYYPDCGLSFHRFPKDPNVREVWTNIIPISSTRKLTDTSVVCSKHFKAEDFVAGYSRPVLKCDAVPSVFLLAEKDHCSALTLRLELGTTLAILLTVFRFNRAMADGSISDNERSDKKDREFSLLIISLYKDHPELWNTKCYGYSNKYMRRKGLDEITNALKQYKPYYNEQMLRRKINILRTNFNKEYRKREQMRLNGHDPDNFAPMWYFDALIFLKDESYADTTEPSEGRFYMIDPNSRPAKRKLDSDEKDDAVSLTYEQTEESDIKTEILDDKFYSSDDSYIIEQNIIPENDQESSVAPSQLDIYQTVSEHDAVGINVAKKLAKMDPPQAIYAESIINNVLRRGLECKLNDDTDLCDEGCSRVKYTLDNRILIKKTKNAPNS